MQNRITDAVDRFCRADSQHGRWQVAQQVMADLGGEWLTLGTAPSDRLNRLSVLSSNPAAMVRDYMSENLHQIDQWMEYSARHCTPRETSFEGQPAPGPDQLDRRIVRVMVSHGMRHAILIPGVSDVRTRALLLCAGGKEEARALRASDQRSVITTLAAVVTAMIQPDEMPAGDPQHFLFEPILSPREREALLWLSTGLRTAEIAHRMGIESVTVSLHISSVRRKLGARTREQALVIALRDGLIQP